MSSDDDDAPISKLVPVKAPAVEDSDDDAPIATLAK